MERSELPEQRRMVAVEEVRPEADVVDTHEIDEVLEPVHERLEVGQHCRGGHCDQAARIEWSWTMSSHFQPCWEWMPESPLRCMSKTASSGVSARSPYAAWVRA